MTVTPAVFLHIKKEEIKVCAQMTVLCGSLILFLMEEPGIFLKLIQLGFWAMDLLQEAGHVGGPIRIGMVIGMQELLLQSKVGR